MGCTDQTCHPVCSGPPVPTGPWTQPLRLYCLPVLNSFSSLSSLPHPDSTKIPCQAWRNHTGLWGGGIPWIQSGPSLTGIWAMWRILGQAQGRDIMLPQDSGHTSGFAHQDTPSSHASETHTGTRPKTAPAHPSGHTHQDTPSWSSPLEPSPTALEKCRFRAGGTVQLGWNWPCTG